MTISSTANRTSDAGDDSTTAFSFPYLFFADDDLVVTLKVDSTGVETTQTITTDYTVTGAGVTAGGTVTMGTPPASGETLIISRSEQLTQGLDLVENDPFPSDLVEQQFDSLTMIVQQQQEILDRTLRYPIGDTSGLEAEMAASVTRANKYLGFDSTGAVSLDTTIGNYRSSWLTSTAYVVNDVVSTGSPASSYICLVAHTSGTFATDLAAAKWQLVAEAGATGATGAAGSDGTMAGPVSSTDNGIATYNGTDGTTVQDTAWTIDDSEVMVVGGAITGGANTASDLVLKDTAETTVAKGNFGATPAWDVSAGNAQWGTVDQAITSSTMTNWPATGATGYLALEVINGGAYSIVWPTSVDWVGGTAPTLTASGTDQLIFRSRDAGTTVLGWVVGLDIK
ncbi:hypothetical protein N9878_00550 [bacterium]|nr:hypothetical protein [bacterium]